MKNRSELDFTKIKNFFTNKTLLKYSFLLLLIVPMILAAHFRLYPATLPIADEWAENSINANIKNSIAQQINSQYPNLPDANKQSMINDNFNKYVEANKDQIEAGILQSSEGLRQQFKNSNGETYLLAIDPYTYYRQTVNMVETGHAYDEVDESGQAFNALMRAPKGTPMTSKFGGASFHVWASFLWHKLISFFKSDISVMGSIFFMPVIFSVLSVIPAFFLARRAGGNVAGFFAAVIVGIHPVFLGRTPAGFADTDAYNVFFPLLISWLFIEAFENKDLIKKLSLTSLAGLATGLYSFAWNGWWYIFDFILISMIGYLVYYMILHRDEMKKGFKKYINQDAIKNPAMILLTFFIVSGIFVTIFASFGAFINAPIAPIAGLGIKDAAKADLWPNVYTTVAELNSASVASIVAGIGGEFMFLIAIMGMILTTSSVKSKKNLGFIFASFAYLIVIIGLQAKLGLTTFIVLLGLPVALILSYYLYTKQEDVDIKYAIFFTIWFLGTIYTTTKGIRFLLLMVPVYGVAFGIAIGKFYRYVIDWVDEELDLNKALGTVVIGGLLLLLLITPIKSADATALREVPSMNDGWFNSLNKINQEAAPDAIINSWWDFGHWFKAFGNRSVTFDGASQNTPMAHWIGKTLLTNNEKEAIGILRMLDCGSNDAFEVLKEEGISTVNSVEIITKTISSNNQRQTLLDNNVENVDGVLALTSCDAPENYFITSQDMIGKSGVWAHFGSWDFKRATVWNEYRSLSKSDFDVKTSELGFNKTESSEMYYDIQALTEGRAANTWIAPWPSYASGLTACTQNGLVLNCQNGLIVNLTNMDAYIPTQQGNLQPKRFSYIDVDGNFVAVNNEKGKVLTANDGSFIGASLIQQNGRYYTIMMHEELVDSMFNRLFYYDGKDLNGFEKFSDVTDVTGAKIIVWKVNWND